ncbi:MAG: hypothetical protein MJ057_07360 [Sphaerochaetaceae bacterium]|nr:hypothetical protein [Sphaerochaetaceae bacterium]
MALKRKPEDSVRYDEDVAVRANNVFSGDSSSRGKEKKILTTFSIEPSFKKELEDLFSELGLGWAAGIRFALKEFSKKYKN